MTAAMKDFPRPFSRLVQKVVEEIGTLTREEARLALREMVLGEAETDDISRMLTAISQRGETAEELAGFAEEMRAHAVPLPFTEDERAALVDTCGTGGSGDGTFNISTGAALVAAAAGAKVAKHGNRAVTSKCGSADVLEAMGIPVALTPEQSVACLRATGFTFLYAPALHPALKRVQPIRRALGFRTIFNMAGPLTNPAGARAQVMGVYAANKVVVAAEALARLGVRHAMVVHGSDGLDELTLTGMSHMVEVRDGLLRRHEFYPSEADLPFCTLDALQGAATVAENAAVIERILRGESGPRTDIVLLNAAAALVVSGVATSFREGVARCAIAIESGAARQTVEKLRAFGRSIG
jgi:anthranilate phosphoribosyltransferase